MRLETAPRAAFPSSSAINVEEDREAPIERRRLCQMMSSIILRGPFQLEFGAIGYAGFCALVSFLVTCLVARSCTTRRRLLCCVSAWGRILAGAGVLYLIKLLDEQNGDVSVAYVPLFVVSGAWLLAHDSKEFGLASNLGAVGVSSATLILALTGTAYMAFFLRGGVT